MKKRVKIFLMKNRHFLPFIGFRYDWIILFYVVLAMMLSFSYQFKIRFNYLFDITYDGPFLLLVLSFFVVQFTAVAFQFRKRGRERFLFGSHWWRYVKARYGHWYRLFDLIRVLILLKLVLIIYFNIKQAIPLINPALYDQAFLDIDCRLHGGLNLNKWLPTLNNRYFSWSIDLLYVSWFLLKPIILAFFVTLKNRQKQCQFFGAYFSIWIVGGLTALLLPTLGPVYTNPGWYGQLLKPFATTLQKVLFEHYQQVIANPNSYNVFSYEGIAAFPSLHVGVAALFALFLTGINRFGGCLMWLYTGGILFGSVYLGWHYAVDGYWGIGMAYCLFRMFGGRKRTRGYKKADLPG